MHYSLLRRRSTFALQSFRGKKLTENPCRAGSAPQKTVPKNGNTALRCGERGTGVHLCDIYATSMRSDAKLRSKPTLQPACSLSVSPLAFVFSRRPNKRIRSDNACTEPGTAICGFYLPACSAKVKILLEANQGRRIFLRLPCGDAKASLEAAPPPAKNTSQEKLF
jgi:hypothetical protein